MLENKVAIVTGASRGIGRAIALKLAEKGANVLVNYSSSANEAEEVVTLIKNMGRNAVAVKASVDNADDVSQMFKICEEKLGAVDILVNNAGITKDNLLLRMSDEEWDKVIAVNLKGAFLCTRAAIKVMMKKRYGKIINISSVVGFSGNAGQFNYCAAKAGLIGMTKSVAIELGGRGVRVNAVAPGFIETDMTAKLSDELKNEFIGKVPLKSLGKSEDVANAVLFLASPDSDYITGQTIHVNGGLYM